MILKTFLKIKNLNKGQMSTLIYISNVIVFLRVFIYDS